MKPEVRQTGGRGARQRGRRAFLQAATVLPALALCGGGLAAAGPVSAALARDQVDPEKDMPAEARAWLELVKIRYGSHLSAVDEPAILGDLRNAVRASERLASAKLANADEPDFVFSAV
jgi:hypothetical protein